MGPDKKKNLEEAYLCLDKRILDFFPGGEESELSQEEERSLTPILNSLQDYSSRYEFLKDIAAGAEKQISLVFDRRLDRCVAMARARKGETKESQEEFLREARLLAQLVHPYIPPVYNMGIDEEGHSFFTMELLPGEDMHQVLKRLKQGDDETRKAFPLKERLRIFLKTCEAVEYVHSRNVIHRDLKPGNLKHGGYGQVFVCDWGLARVLTDEEDATQDGSLDPSNMKTIIDGNVVNQFSLSDFVKGTPGYMSPEQSYESTAATRLSDVYSLGAILYSFLVYELPVDGENTLEVLENTKAGAIIPVQQRKNGVHVPSELAAVAHKALALDPLDRYESAGELGEEINQYLNGYVPVAAKVNVFRRMSLFIQRHSDASFIALSGLGLLLVLASGSAVTINRQRSEAVAQKQEAMTQKQEAVAQRERAEENLKLYKQEQEASTQFGVVTDMALNIAYGSPDLDTLFSLKSVLADELERKKLTNEQRDHLLLLKGSVHFYLEEFGAAQAALVDILNPSYDCEVLLRACAEALTMKQDDSVLLGEADLAKVLGPHEDYYIPRRVILMTYLCHIGRDPYQPNTDEYLALASIVLSSMNGYPAEHAYVPVVKQGPNGIILDISGSGLSLLRLPQMGHQLGNVLGPVIDVDVLDISYSGIVDISEIGGITASTVRMVGLSLNAPRHAVRYLINMGVKKVIIDVDNYPQSVIEDCRGWFEVIDEPSK